MQKFFIEISKSLIKIILLFLLINWDKVIGLPISFLIASLFLLSRRELKRQLWLLVVQIVLFVSVFGIPLFEAGLILLVGLALWTKTSIFKLARFFWLSIVSLTLSLVVGIQLGFARNLWIYAGVALSLLVALTIRRMRQESWR